MKNVLLSLILLPFISFANPELSPSLLDRTAQIEGFGAIKYRAPIVKSDAFPILLVHGVYGGASHRTFRQILPLLARI